MPDKTNRERHKQRLAGLCQEMIERLDSGGTFGEIGVIAKHAARTAEMLGRFSPPAEMVTFDQKDQGFPPLVKHYRPEWSRVTMMKLHDPYVGYWEFITAVDAPDGAARTLSTDRAKIRTGAINVLRRWVRWCECPDAGDRTDWHDPIIDPADFLSMMKESLAVPPVEQQGGTPEPPAEGAEKRIGTAEAAQCWHRGRTWWRARCAAGDIPAERSGKNDSYIFAFADAAKLARERKIASRPVKPPV